MTVSIDGEFAYPKNPKFQSRSQHELFSRLKAFTIARLLIGTTLLIGTAIPLEVTGIYSSSRFLFPLITSILLLTIIYSFLLNVLKNLVILAYLQLFGDILLETAVLTATGGIESPFSILYVLTIVTASYLIPKHGAVICAFIISVIFGAVILCQYQAWTSWWPLESPWVLLPPPSFAFYIIFINMSGFYLTAFLSTHLSGRLSRINTLLKNRNVQYSYLYTLNQRIINEIPTGLITTNREGYIISMNPCVEKMLGFKTEDSMQPHLNQIFPKYLVQSILQFSDTEPMEKRQINFERHTNNEELWLNLEVIMLARKSEDPARLMMMISDITDQKRFEDERRKAERWSTVAEVSAGMAHEIRNPLASISGSVEVLKEHLELSDSEARLMDIIIRESERLNKLISDFLDLARPRQPEFFPINVSNLLMELKLLISHSGIWNENIDFQLDLSEPDLVADLDSDQFQQMMWNLAKNALESMQDGGVLTISASVWHELETSLIHLKTGYVPNLPYLKIMVQDSGIGMSKEIKERIFDPFTTFKRKGVGIGLAIVYRIVETHRGQIYVESEEGEGTTFTIRLPLKHNAEINPR